MLGPLCCYRPFPHQLQLRAAAFTDCCAFLQYAFGPRLGLWIIVPCQLVVMLGLGIVYTVTGGRSLQRSEHQRHTHAAPSLLKSTSHTLFNLVTANDS